MRMSGYPDCCRARVLSSFGGGHIHESNELANFLKEDWMGAGVATKEQVKTYLDDAIPRLKGEGITVIFACPTSHQPSVIEALQEYGFYGAEQEDLDSAGFEYVVKNRGEKLSIKHQMVPMFYLIPRTGSKVVDYN